MTKKCDSKNHRLSVRFLVNGEILLSLLGTITNPRDS